MSNPLVSLWLTPNTAVWSAIFGSKVKALLVTGVQREARNLSDTSARKIPFVGHELACFLFTLKVAPKEFFQFQSSLDVTIKEAFRRKRFLETHFHLFAKSKMRKSLHNGWKQEERVGLVLSKNQTSFPACPRRSTQKALLTGVNASLDFRTPTSSRCPQ